MAASAYYDAVQKLYVAYYGRPADPAGLVYWAEQIDAKGGDASAVVNAFGDSAEAQAIYGDVAVDVKVDNVFQNILGRAADDAGKAWYVGELEAGRMTLAELAQRVLDGASTGTDAATVANKLVAAKAYTAALDTPAEVSGYVGTDAAAKAKTYLSVVTSDEASIPDAAAVDAAVAKLTSTEGKTFTLTTADDTLVGTAGNDTFTGTSTTFAAADFVLDQSSTDSDTYNLTVTANATPKATGVENINIAANSLDAVSVDAANLKGVKVLSITRGDVVVGGSTLNGNKTVVVNNADSANIAAVTVGAGTTTVDINGGAALKAGLVVNADNAKTSVNVDGAATINAAIATGTVAVDAVSNTDKAETDKATVINAAKAATVTTHADLTGAITIKAAAATTVTVNDAQGGVTIDAQAAKSTITVVDIDASGATITAGVGTKTDAINLVLDGTAKTDDAASIKADGVVSLDIDGAAAGNVDVLKLAGNTAAVTYTIANPDAGTFTSLSKEGSQTVTVKGAHTTFTGTTVTGIDVVELTTAAAADVDASKFSNVGKIVVSYDIGANQLTVVDGQVTEVKTNQTALDFDYATGAKNLSLVVGDVNGDSTAVGTLTVGAFNAAAGASDVGNVTITAEESNLTATSVVIGAKQTLVLKGDEDFTLGNVTAKNVDATAATGVITLTSAGNVTTVATGSGDDSLTADSDSVHNLSAGAGDDTITVTDAAATSQFAGGAGNDSFTLTEVATAYVAVGDAGNDTFTAGDDFNAVIVGGEGSDTLKLTGAADFSLRTSFAFSSIEKLDSGANAVVLTSTQFANNNAFEVTGTSTVTVNGVADAANTIDASKVTVASGSTATLVLEGNNKVDTITGSGKNDTINGTKGDDVIDGGAGTDTFVGTTSADNGTGAATVINLGSGAVSGTEVLNKTGLRTAGDVAVASGTAATSFNDTTSTNDASVATLSNIENATGTNGKDYIVGSAGNNSLSGAAGADYIDGGDGNDTITGGAGADVLKGGLGDDTFKFAVGDSVASTAANYAAATIAAADTITFGNSVDLITDFTATDKLDVTTAAAAPTTLIGVTAANNLTAGTSYVAYGTWNASTNVFTIAAAFDATTAKDAMVVTDGNAQTLATATGVVILDDLAAALQASNMI